MPRKLLCLAAAAALSACKGEDTPAPAPATDTAAAKAGRACVLPEINAGDFAEMVKTLASDEFEGRAPGSKGEERRSTTSATRCSASACSPATATAGSRMYR